MQTALAFRSDSDSMNAVDSGHGTGSVLVDYIVELTDLGRHVDTQEMKKLFHSSLTAAEHDAVVSSRLQLGRFVLDPKYTDFIGKLYIVLQSDWTDPEQGNSPSSSLCQLAVIVQVTN
jgi:hypothetical protein